jgi:hypothetical protein
MQRKPSSASYRQQTIVIANIRFVPQLKSAKTLVLTLTGLEPLLGFPTTISGESVIGYAELAFVSAAKQSIK